MIFRRKNKVYLPVQWTHHQYRNRAAARQENLSEIQSSRETRSQCKYTTRSHCWTFLGQFKPSMASYDIKIQEKYLMRRPREAAKNDF